MPQVLGEAGTVIDVAIAGARGAPPRRRIGSGPVVCHGRVVCGNGAANMCRVARWMRQFMCGFAMSGALADGAGGSDVAHVRAGVGLYGGVWVMPDA